MKSCTGVLLRADLTGQGHPTLFGRNWLIGWIGYTLKRTPVQDSTLLVSHIKKLETYFALFIFLDFRTVWHHLVHYDSKGDCRLTNFFDITVSIIYMIVMQWRDFLDWFLSYRFFFLSPECDEKLEKRKTLKNVKCIKNYWSFLKLFFLGTNCSVQYVNIMRVNSENSMA